MTSFKIGQLVRRIQANPHHIMAQGSTGIVLSVGTWTLALSVVNCVKNENINQVFEKGYIAIYPKEDFAPCNQIVLKRKPINEN